MVPVLLVNLGLVPLYVEEPRRAVVALEMIFRGNWLVPTINGEYYYLKPPFFNWILASVYELTGNAGEFNTRIASVFSLLMLGAVIWWAGEKYVSRSFGLLSALLFITASGNLFFNSLLAEIDLFYSLVTFTGLVCLFHLHQKKKYLLLFLVFYFLAAVGTLTKGLPSLVFAGWSVLVWFTVNREFKRLFSFSHLLGILLYLAVVGGYFLAYNRQGDALTYIAHLSFESGKRLSSDTGWDIIRHIILYPLDTLWNLLPASLLIVLAFSRSLVRTLRENAYVRFSLLMLLIHFPIYWLPPGGRQRYIIMLYPLIIQGLVYLYLKGMETSHRHIFLLHRVLAGMTGLAALACLAAVIPAQLRVISGLIPVCLAAAALLAAIFVVQWKHRRLALAGMIAALLVLRMVFNLVLLPERSVQGAAFHNKKMAEEIIRITGNDETGVYRGTDFPMQANYYFERERKAVLPVFSEPVPGAYLILEKPMLEPYRVYRQDRSSWCFDRNLPLAQWDSSHVALAGFSYEVKAEFVIDRKRHHRSHFVLVHIPDE